MKVYLIIIYLNLLVFLVPWIADLFLNYIFDSEPNLHILTLIIGGNNSQAVFTGNQYYRMLTSIFLHGNLTHITANMFSLWQLGYPVEIVFGKARFTLIYIVSGLTGSFFSIFFQNQNLSVGSSGAIFGLLGTIFIWSLVNKKWNILKIVLINLILNIWLGLVIPQIDNFAHLGGFIGGIIVTIFFLKEAKKEAKKNII